jgi:two-component system chemotaxis response regulator CheY
MSANESVFTSSHPLPSILVVDDDEEVRQLLVGLLTAARCDVNTANDGAAGWEALRANRYDLVITDNNMPKVTGLEMIEQLHAAHMSVPVIMVTGILPQQAFKSKPWLRPGVILLKPFTADDLLEAVKKMLPQAGET